MTIKYFIHSLFLGTLLLVAIPDGVYAQNWGVVRGSVLDSNSGEVIPGVTVIVDGTQTGTATNDQGRFSFRLPERSWLIRFSYVGYEAVERQVETREEVDVVLTIRLKALAFEIGDVEVEGDRVSEDISTEIITPEQIQQVPAPFKDAYRILKVMPGVATNNELSNEYSVRGGGYNENQVLINGFEVYKPLRIRQGSQEGLGLVNPDMVQSMTFYTGGFPARYGGKLSSALDVEYRFPSNTIPSGSVYMSMLDGGATVGLSGLNNKLSANLGYRKSRPAKFFGTQDTKGEYDPDYSDYQTALKWEPKNGHSIEFLGMISQQRFRLQPRSRNTQFGSLDFLQSIQTTFTGQEEDAYDIGFGGIRLVNNINNRFTAVHGLSLFRIEESENIDVKGDIILFLIPDPFEPNPNYVPTGIATQRDFADNEVTLRDLGVQGSYVLTGRKQVVEAGWYGKQVSFTDRIDERTILGGRSIENLPVETLVDSLRDSASLESKQLGAHLQHVIDLDETEGRLLVTSGIRTDYFDFSEELTFSPRISARYRRTENLTLSLAAGVYHQAPNYKEFRGSPQIGTPLESLLNSNLKSQRSAQLITGLRYFYPARRFFLKAEAYYKKLDNIISYEAQNIRLDYSGENDAKGYAYGLDLQIRGEIVPGLESWFNYGFLVSREKFLDQFLNEYNQGWRRRPNDQRHTFSVFVQDYVPNDPSWKLHLRLLFGSGLPYTPPIPGMSFGDFETQVPGERLSDQYPPYQRVDMGATKKLTLFKPKNGKPITLGITGEILNVFDHQNVISYQWIADVTGRWNRIPTRLTPRTVNVRARIEW